jgi:hypothetical protein
VIVVKKGAYMHVQKVAAHEVYFKRKRGVFHAKNYIVRINYGAEL